MNLATTKAKLKSGAQAGVQALNKAGHAAKTGTVAAGKATVAGAKSLYLTIPKDYDIEKGGSLNELIKAADELGIARLQEDANNIESAKKSIDTVEKLLSFTQTGVAVSAKKLDELLQKYSSSQLAKSLGSSANIDSKLTKTNHILSTLSSFLGTALAGMDLDSLVKQGDASATDLAKASLDLINELVNNISNSVQSIEAFSEQLGRLGAAISQTKGLSGLGNKLQNLPNFGKANLALEMISGLLSGISAGFTLADKNASTEKKVAAGFELSNQVIGNVTKAISSYVLAQRAAAGLSTTGAVASLITASIMLAISPLAFMNAADKFKNASLIDEFAKQFKKFGYDGDSLLAEYQRGAGTIEASLTAINTALGAVSAGVSAAAVGSVVGSPVALLVAGVTGLISGILEASKQAMFESVANRLQSKILAWEKENGGKNYFENGYDARHAHYLERNLKLLSELNKELQAERVIAITQQRWDANIGELAGITKLGDRISSGKAYADAFEDGKKLDGASNVTVDTRTGVVDISNANGKKTQALHFTSPLLTAGTETRERVQNGKYSYINQLKFNRVKSWTVKDGEANSRLDFSKVIQHVAFNDEDGRLSGKTEEIALNVNAGSGNDDIFAGQGKMNVDGGTGHDRVFYSKDGGLGQVNVDGTKATEAGSYTVNRSINNGSFYHEVIKRQTTQVGKRTETLEYRDFELKRPEHGYQTTDTLKSVEEIVGSQFSDTFKGSKFADIFHGGDGNDTLEGNDGDDRLFGGNGDDHLYGGNGDDLLDGGKGNDVINGGDGNDVYISRKGDGNDTLYDSHGSDKLAFADADLSELTIERTAQGIMIKRNDGSGSINMAEWYKTLSQQNYHGNATDDKIEQIIGKNGDYITSEQIDKLLKDKQTGTITSAQLQQLAQENKSKSIDSGNLASTLNKLIESMASFGSRGATASNYLQPAHKSPQNVLAPSAV
ncbi:RTX family hemolysin [Kingella kingae]|uniref:Cytolysin RtxA n=5 Tax=Kingella TaxID=32257 RepID=RTXA_KINKI|nr:RTX family hemolysin [Kingella kingae]A1YKW7.1 RecName: Full=Cytolysin RtxA; AltName: Full=Repeats in toxin A [Kingella kingae]ABK58601.1 RtxA [Kingella kingae]MDK4556042.1 RTX family hemolysin [Kingella kingae]MDK4589110.1 RTX family hemolysin [Kingella kingae]MDK4597344.1 RTX family hemolysin [Kingella kingae]MDK4601288.1 RTX family hemolysin [Kingella kingae]